MDIEKLKQFIEPFLDSPSMRQFAPNPDNHPEIIYKYRNWEDVNHRNLLAKNELFLSSPRNLNDPFDCRIIENYINNLNTKQNKDTYLTSALERDIEYLNENGISIQEAEKVLRERIADPLHYQVRAEYNHREITDKFVGITCFSEKWDSILMWTHYGNNHKGYCVGFDEKRVRLFIHGKLKRVNYSDQYPELNPMLPQLNSYELKYFYKSYEWEYEKEIRLMKIFENDARQNNNERIINFKDNFIKEIILGLQINESAKQEIISIAKDKGIPVWQSVKAEFEFKIERYLI